MKKSILHFLFVSLFLTVVCCQGKRNEDSRDVAEDVNEENGTNDSKFAVDAADGGMLEVQLGTLAASKGTSSRVKAFGQMMVDDHTKANNELKALAAEKNIVLPDVMSEDAQKKYYDLDQKDKGEDFDKEYIDLMVKDHKKDINEFQKESDNGDDPQIKSWASQKLIVLQHHLHEAEAIQESLKE